MSPLPQRCTLLAHEEATLPLSLSPSPWPSPLQLPSPLPSLLPLPTPLPSLSPSPSPLLLPIAHCCHCCHWPLPLRSPSTIAATISVASLSAIAVAVALAIGNFRLHHRRPLQLPSPLAIRCLLPSAISKSCCLVAARIVFEQFKQRMVTLFYFVWTVSGALIKAR